MLVVAKLCGGAGSHAFMAEEAFRPPLFVADGVFINPLLKEPAFIIAHFVEAFLYPVIWEPELLAAPPFGIIGHCLML